MSLPGRYSVTMKEEYTEDTWPEARWPNFSHKEFVCSLSGLCFLDSEMMDHLQAIRGSFGRGMRITSGYRDDKHPIEAKKMCTYVVEMRIGFWPWLLNMGLRGSVYLRRVAVAFFTWTGLSWRTISMLRGHRCGVTNCPGISVIRSW